MFQKFLIPHPSRAVQGIDFALRLWLGYTMVSNAPVGVTIPLDSIGLDPASYQFLHSLWETGYLMHLTKAIELLAGLALILHLWTGLALVLLFPVLVNIVGVTAHYFPGGLPRNGALLGSAAVLAFFRLNLYRPLLRMRPQPKEITNHENRICDGGHPARSHQDDPALSGAL